MTCGDIVVCTVEYLSIITQITKIITFHTIC